MGYVVVFFFYKDIKNWYCSMFIVVDFIEFYILEVY